MSRRNSCLLMNFGMWPLLLLSCANEEEIKPMTVEEEKETEIEENEVTDTATIAYLALGDSYTIGAGVEEKERYPLQLADSLQSRGIDIPRVKIVARTGWTTKDLSAALKAEAFEEGEYNLVSLLIGVNNQYRGLSLEQYRQEFTVLLDRAIAYAGGNRDRVFVISIPDYGITPFGQLGNPQKIAEEIDRFNDASKAITVSRNVRYFDITPISREAKEDRSLLASDGLHPSGKMYTRWVKLMLSEVLRMLQ